MPAITTLEDAIDQGTIDDVNRLLSNPLWRDSMTDQVNLMNKLIEKKPSAVMTVLDKCYSDLKNQVDEHQQTRRTFDFINGGTASTWLSSTWPASVFFKSIDGSYSKTYKMWPLQTLADYGRLDCLRHPLVRILLDCRWTKYGKFIKGFRTIWLAFMLLSLIIYSFSIVECSQKKDHSKDTNESKNAVELLNETNITTKPFETCHGGTSEVPAVTFSWFLCIMSILSIVFQGFSIILSMDFGLNMLFPQDYIALVLYITTAIFTAPTQDFYWCQRNSGVVAIISALISLVLSTRWLPKFGIISICITYTMWNLVLVAYFYIILYLAAFGAAFHLLLYDKVEFKSLHFSTAILMNIAHGEIDFERLFLENNDNPYKWRAVLLEVLFLFTVNIALMQLVMTFSHRYVSELLKDAEAHTRIYEIAELQTCEAMFRKRELHHDSPSWLRIWERFLDICRSLFRPKRNTD